MKKFFLLLFIVVALASICIAQTENLPRPTETYYVLQGDQALNVSIGLLNMNDFTFGLFQADGKGNPSPSINASYEYGLLKNIRIAGFTSFYRVESSNNFDINSLADQISNIDITDFGSVINEIQCILNPESCATTVKERVSVFTIGGKLSIHKPFVEGLDTYASTYLGYSFNRRKTVTEQALDVAVDQLGLNTDIPTIVYYASAGARYFITPKIGIFGEYGLGNVHLLKLGATYKLN